MKDQIASFEERIGVLRAFEHPKCVQGLKFKDDDIDDAASVNEYFFQRVKFSLCISIAWDMPNIKDKSERHNTTNKKYN